MKITDIETRELLAPNYDARKASSVSLHRSGAAGTLVDGVISRPTRPELGVELHREALQGFRVK